MSIQLNPNSPSPQVTEYLQKLGLQLGTDYKTQWSEYSSKDWDIIQGKEIVISLPFEQVQKMIASKIFITRFPWKC